MQAVVGRRYGSADGLEIESIGRPSIGADEVLIEVHAAGLDRGTWHLMTGLPYLVRIAGFGFTKPKNPVLGSDVAGRVVDVGSEVTEFAPGDAVFGFARGSFAEYAAAPANKLVRKPDALSFEQAAVAPVSGVTALQALTDVGQLEPGQRALVLGASGGVGTFAVQLARALGAKVTGVARGSKLAMVRSIGADEVVDYEHEDFAAVDRGYDLILDMGGRNRLSRLRSALTPRGTLVIVGGEGGNRWTGGSGRQLRALFLSRFTPQRLKAFIASEDRRSLERLAGYLQSGAVMPVIGQRFPLAEARDALRRMEAGEASGKSVIVVRETPSDPGP